MEGVFRLNNTRIPYIYICEDSNKFWRYSAYSKNLNIVDKGSIDIGSFLDETADIVAENLFATSVVERINKEIFVNSLYDKAVKEYFNEKAYERNINV